MLSQRVVRAGLTVALCLAGCGSGPPPGKDAAVGDDTSDAAAPADLQPIDIALPAETEAAETATIDRAANESPAAERPGMDAPADGSRGEAPAADRPSMDGSGDADCTGWSTLQRLSPAEVSDLIATANPIVINVHIPYAGDIPGTDVDIPYNTVDAIESYLNHDHCADLLLVCLSGGMSQSAGNELIKRGYQRVRDLNGGMSAWQNAGYTLLKDGGT